MYSRRGRRHSPKRYKAVRLQVYTLIGSHSWSHCSFINRDDIDFLSAHELPPQQTLRLSEDYQMEIDYPLQ